LNNDQVKIQLYLNMSQLSHVGVEVHLRSYQPQH